MVLGITEQRGKIVKKGMILFPPEWLPINPYASMPMLAGQLYKAGYPVICKDSNLEFFDYILNKKYLEQVSQQLTNYEESSIHHIIDHIEEAIETFKSGTNFYDVNNYHRAMKTLDDAFEMVSERYPGQKISLYDFLDIRFNWDYRNLVRICSNQMSNMFYDFYMEQIEYWKAVDIDYICITMPCYTQLIPAFTLTYLLKKYTNITVCVGGNILTRLTEGIRTNKNLLDIFCDYVLLGDGECSIIKFADFIHGKLEAEEVPGMIWKEGYQLFANPVDKKRHMESIAWPVFDGIDLNNYYCPEVTFAIELARGCYWRKCSFCAVDISQKKYCMRPMEHLIQEIEYLVKQHGIRNFVFVDEAIPVKKYIEFADHILERKLDIHFYSFARMEKGYTYEVLKHLKKAGLSILWWGYESKSKRIMELMNKGIDVEERISILENAYKAGIWNHGLCMAGFPTESLEEIQSTFNEIRQNRKLFNSCAMNAFFLSYNSPMYCEPEKFGITSISIPNAFESHCHFKMHEHTEKEYHNIVAAFRKEYALENKNRLWPLEYNNFDHLLMYIKHYGCERVREYDAENNRCF